MTGTRGAHGWQQHHRLLLSWIEPCDLATNDEIDDELERLARLDSEPTPAVRKPSRVRKPLPSQPSHVYKCRHHFRAAFNKTEARCAYCGLVVAFRRKMVQLELERAVGL